MFPLHTRGNPVHELMHVRRPPSLMRAEKLPAERQIDI